MPEPITISRGMPVAVGSVARELGKLWRDAGDVTTRASLLNFVVWCRGEPALDANTEFVAEFVKSHACRAVVLTAADASGLEKPEVSAWIGAHCHVSRAGSKQVCCEQITLLVRGGGATVISNLILSHLDSDLPLYLFLQDSLPEEPDPQLWTWVDRLFFDSATWGDFPAEARRFMALAEAFRLDWGDLNWTRLVSFRLAIVRLFEPAIHRNALKNIGRIEIVHGERRRSTALLLAGWIATRLGWPAPVADGPGRMRAGDAEICFEEKAGPAVASCALTGPRIEFRIGVDPGSGLVLSSSRIVAAAPHQEALPGLRDHLADLLDEELTHGTRHLPYFEALNWILSDDLRHGE
jgi:glucose-6-phosphate dehydrogenase assembly protein OpcA